MPGASPAAPPRCLLLDLDGTLVDSVPDLTTALNRLMTARGLAAFEEREVVPMVGEGAAVLVARAFVARGRQAGEQDVADMVADYTEHAADASRPYPGVLDALDALRAGGWLLAVCTNKPVAAARVVLRALDLERRVDAVGGGDSFAVRKPHPGHLTATLAAAGGVLGRCAMLGDHHNDVAAAAAAGMPAIFAGWGYGPPAMAQDAAMVAATVAEVPALVERLVPP